MDDVETERPPSPARLSKTPSWIMLGFVLGAVAMWSWRLESDRVHRAMPVPVPEPPPVKLERPQQSEIEAVFSDWGRFAVWHHDITEVGLWDREKREFAIFYEVLRNGDAYYFRSIPKLTRPVLTHGVNPQSPLQFTETEEARREWMQRGQFEARGGTP